MYTLVAEKRKRESKTTENAGAKKQARLDVASETGKVVLQTAMKRKAQDVEEQEATRKRVRFALASVPDKTVLDGSQVVCRVFKEFVPSYEADAALKTLLEGMPWRQDAPVVYGVVRKMSREVCAFGDAGTSYAYSGTKNPATPWEEGPELLSELKGRIEEALDCKFNFCLAVHYPDGKAGLGWHADDEKDLVPGAMIASLSFGVRRPFYLRRNDDHYTVADIELGRGDLCTMEGNCQKRWKHHVPPRKKITKPRICLTFRLVKQ
jgi:alkylated DNA repair dioxygenase AlkB